MGNIKLIIFDLDGTLVNAYPAIEISLNFVLKKFGYPPRNAREVIRAVGWGDENLLKPFVKPEELKRALVLYRRHHLHALVRHSRLFPKVKALLDTLENKGYKLAVASNRPTRFSLILIRHLGIAKYFNYHLCADRLIHGKPHPEILYRIIRHLHVKPSETLYVGDMVIDAQAGRRAGIRTIIVTTGSSTLGEIKKEKPLKIISRISDLLKLL